MIPLTPCHGIVASAGEGGAFANAIARVDTLRSAIVVEGGGLPVHGSKVERLGDLGGTRHATQTGASGVKPLFDTTLVPGLRLVRCNAGRFLQMASSGGIPVDVFVLAYVATTAAPGQVALTQDTTATTALPAFELRAA